MLDKMFSIIFLILVVKHIIERNYLIAFGFFLLSVMYYDKWKGRW
jgi:hypothetical protein